MNSDSPNQRGPARVTPARVRSGSRHPVRSRLGPAGPRAIGAVGSALPSHGRGHQFESGIAHHELPLSPRRTSRTDDEARPRPARTARDPARTPRGACRRCARCRAARRRPTMVSPANPRARSRWLRKSRSPSCDLLVSRTAKTLSASLATHDQNGAVLAASVVLGVGHPRPDDLTGVGIAVDVGRIADPQPIGPGRVDLDGRRIAGAADRIGSRRRRRRRCGSRAGGAARKRREIAPRSPLRSVTLRP